MIVKNFFKANRYALKFILWFSAGNCLTINLNSSNLNISQTSIYWVFWNAGIIPVLNKCFSNLQGVNCLVLLFYPNFQILMHTSFLFWARGLFNAVAVFACSDKPIVGVTFTTTIHGAILDKIWSYEVKQLNKNATYLWANWTTILASWLAAIRTLAPDFVRFLTAFAFGNARSSFESTNIARGTDATSSLGAKLNFWVKFLKNCIKKHE